ncbi:hypothetical protein QNI16_36190 [Cytophagaceae bacterium YF14B1]|uniref:DUF6876 domain-containing protein n=1 Tax=Xanthocytophaga flava TaxID=3048013 RepID=A0AAE3R0Q3_9BACT|nr:DUF6876 family protein [Xanthocytophaga flavus]MDJ1485978.1 hypothetical protein [Xanthocytophaga flavus]
MSLFNLFSQVNPSTDLNTILSEFTGSQCIYRHPLTKLFYTEGVQFLAEKFSCYWLLDRILIEARLNRNLNREEFQVWILSRKEKGFVLSCTDGNGRDLFFQSIPYSDFAAGKVTLWLTDGVLLLPSEY